MGVLLTLPQYDISADGQRSVTVERMETPKPVIRVVQSWFAEFCDRQQSFVVLVKNFR